MLVNVHFSFSDVNYFIVEMSILLNYVQRTELEIPLGVRWGSCHQEFFSLRRGLDMNKQLNSG